MSTIKVNNIESSTGGGVVAKITNRQGKNLVINGDMRIAQRGVSSTDAGYASVDRFKNQRSGNDEAPTYAQVDVASGTTPYSLGFRKAFKITNGNQTGGAGSGDFSTINYVLESQDIATSGWNYKSSSSFITLQFWVKSSIAQNFFFTLFTQDGTQYQYTMETGSLAADTWTKITKTIPGNTNLQFDTDTVANSIARALDIQWVLYRGTDSTGTRPLDTWAALDGATRSPDNTTTWYTTDNATFELTGVQLEVSDHATDFDFELFQETLKKCQRYCYVTPYGASSSSSAGSEEAVQGTFGYVDDSGATARVKIDFPEPMRATPSFTGSSTNVKFRASNTSQNFSCSSFALFKTKPDAYNMRSVTMTAGSLTSMSGATAGFVEFNEAGGFMKFESEL